MKYKVGDRVMVRTDLVGGLEYPYSNPARRKLYFASAMEKFRGEEYEIVASLDDYGCETYSLSLGEEESKWVFNDAMLILVAVFRGTYMQEKKELKVGDWVRVKRNLAVHEIGVKYLGKVYRINRISYTGYYLSGTPEGYWYRSSLIPVGNLSRLVEIRKENHEI